MALAFARFLEADPSQIVMVGDSRHDLDCARAAGAVAVAVLSGPAERGALEPHADFVIDHIGDLPRLLAGLTGAGGGCAWTGRRRYAYVACLRGEAPPPFSSHNREKRGESRGLAQPPLKKICFQQFQQTTSRGASKITGRLTGR